MKRYFSNIHGFGKSSKSYLKLKQILEPTPDQIMEQIQTTQNQNIDTKYQNIIYCMSDRNKTVYYADYTQIDFVKALNELNDLDWAYTKNGISFINLKSDENIFGHRIQQNKWHVISPIKEKGEYCGCQWSSYINHESLIHTVRLFFEEVSWLETQIWSKIKWKDDF